MLIKIKIKYYSPFTAKIKPVPITQHKDVEGKKNAIKAVRIIFANPIIKEL